MLRAQHVVALEHLFLEAIEQRWREALTTRTRSERFKADLLAYRAAPEYYRVKRFMRVLANGMKAARKIVVSTSGPRAPIIRLNLLERPSGLGRLTPEP